MIEQHSYISSRHIERVCWGRTYDRIKKEFEVGYWHICVDLHYQFLDLIRDTFMWPQTSFATRKSFDFYYGTYFKHDT